MVDGINKITVVGLGVIGGSFAMALSARGYCVYGVDKDEKTPEYALRRSYIRDGGTAGEKFYLQSDLIIVALYPTMTADFIEENKAYFKKGAIVCDTAGIKSAFAERVSEMGGDVDYILCHPMAGREKKGIAYADADVFEGANFIITPTSANSPRNLDKIKLLALEIGFGKVSELSPASHDAVVAYTSQLPHALAVALINSDDESARTGDFIGDSYRDLTRIANINSELWTELFLGNRANLERRIDNFEKQLRKIKDALASEDAAALQECFKTSSARRADMEAHKRVK